MKKGDKVWIFQKPDSCEDFEGKAKLIKFQNSATGDLEFWEVLMEDGYKLLRWINIKFPFGKMHNHY